MCDRALLNDEHWHFLPGFDLVVSLTKCSISLLSHCKEKCFLFNRNRNANRNAFFLTKYFQLFRTVVFHFSFFSFSLLTNIYLVHLKKWQINALFSFCFIMKEDCYFNAATFFSSSVYFTPISQQYRSKQVFFKSYSIFLVWRKSHSFLKGKGTINLAILYTNKNWM